MFITRSRIAIDLRLEIDEGPLMTLGTITFEGNAARADTDKLFDFIVGPTRSVIQNCSAIFHSSQSDIQEGTELVHRFISRKVFSMRWSINRATLFHDETNRVDVDDSDP